MQYFKIANYLLILLGLGHNSMAVLKEPPVKYQNLITIMKKTEILSMNIYDMNFGFSIMMGVLLIIVGFLNLVNKNITRTYLSINILMSLVLLTISFSFFFYIPQTFSIFIFLFFIISYRKVSK